MHGGPAKRCEAQIPIVEQHFLEPRLGRFGNAVGDLIAHEGEKVSGRHDDGFDDVVVARLRREGRSR